MAVQRVNVSQEVLSSYIRMSNLPPEMLSKDIPKIDKILAGEISPTFKQLSKLANIINVPTGLLLLGEPINFEKIDLNFRTVDSKIIDEMSPELRDTILEMQEKQDFLREEVENEISFIGFFNYEDDIEKVINKAKSLLGNNNFKNRFETYRKRLNDLGIFIFLNGKIKDNTHRNLDLKEFRGFVLSDKKAPVIFINQKDSKSGQLFTLIHEFIHLLYGEDDLIESVEFDKHGKTEALINRITAEVLLPSQLIHTEFNKSVNIFENIDSFSKKYEVSKFVVNRRFLDLKIIDFFKYKEINETLSKELEDILKLKKKSNGGNYVNNLKFRMDRNFFNYVENAVNENRLSYTDAFSIVGVGYKGYKILSNRGG